MVENALEMLAAKRVIELDAGNSNRLQRVTWIEGEPQKGGLPGYRTRGKGQYATVTLRCPRCGRLLWFAPDAGE